MDQPLHQSTCSFCGEEFESALEGSIEMTENEVGEKMPISICKECSASIHENKPVPEDFGITPPGTISYYVYLLLRIVIFLLAFYIAFTIIGDTARTFLRR